MEDTYEATVDTDRSTHEVIRFFDTEGIDLSRSGGGATLKDSLPLHLLPLIDGLVLVYSVDDEASFQAVEAIRKEVERAAAAAKDKRDLICVVLGNKADLDGLQDGNHHQHPHHGPTAAAVVNGGAGRRVVDKVQALNWAARERVKLFEVSAFDRSSLIEPFVYLSSKLNHPPNKTSFPQLHIGRKQPKE